MMLELIDNSTFRGNSRIGFGGSITNNGMVNLQSTCRYRSIINGDVNGINLTGMGYFSFQNIFTPAPASAYEPCTFDDAKSVAWKSSSNSALLDKEERGYRKRMRSTRVANLKWKMAKKKIEARKRKEAARKLDAQKKQ